MYVWMASWVVYEAIRYGSLILWSCSLLGCLWLYVLGRHLLEGLRVSRSLRDIADEETPPGLPAFLEVWRRSFPKAGALKVSDLFRPGLAMPSYQGRDLYVTTKALAAFTPEALKSGVVMAIMAQMLKLDRNYLIMRLAAMTLAAPGAVIILHSLGFAMGYPALTGPRLIVLVWLAVWFARQVATLIDRHLRKYLVHKLNAAVVAVTANAPALVTAIGTMARYNQVSWKPRWWDRLAGGWPSPQEQIERLAAAVAAKAGSAGAPLVPGAAEPAPDPGGGPPAAGPPQA
jgi:hypothetical protein